MRGCKTDGSLDVDNFGKPLPTIGLYIAVASFCCAAAMAVDTFLGFRSGRFWFPSRYFTLNAATLTVLAIATKLPVDLNTSRPRPVEQLSKLSSTVLICTVMGNLMPSLGMMEDPVSNIVALGILVVTVIVNVAIQMGTGVIYVYLPEHAVIVFFMLVLLILLISSALPIPTTKRQLEKLFDSKHDKLFEVNRRRSGDDVFSDSKLQEFVEKYWLMAHTSSPQYVLGRSATCTASGAFCLVSALVLVEATVRSFAEGRSRFCTGASDYGWSVILVLLSQGIAIVVGTIAPAIRWFAAVSYRSPGQEMSWRDEFRVEKYWVERLTELKEAPVSLQFGNWRCQKITHNSKNLILGLLIKAQMGVVLASKVVRLVSILPVSCLNHGRKLFRKLDTILSSVSTGSPDREEFVLHLEGEDALVGLISRQERKDTRRWIQKGKKNSPTHLTSLIQERIQGGRCFIRVGLIDSNEVPSLVPGGNEPQHCWALPLVTLASIAVALHNVDQSSLKSLLSEVGEGLRYVKQVEKQLEAKGLVNQRKAADMVWSRLSLHYRWRALDLRRLASERQSSRDVIEELGRIGKTEVQEFLMGIDHDGLDRTRALEWPIKVVAANCMYRLTSTILLHCNGNPGMEKDLFCWLRKVISDLLGACLTNLPRAIYLECFCSTIELREESVRGAAFLLGEAGDIMSLLANEASSYPEDKAYVVNWREMVGSNWKWSLDDDTPPASSSSRSSITLSAESLRSISSTHLNSFATGESVTSVEFTEQQVPPDSMV